MTDWSKIGTPARVVGIGGPWEGRVKLVLEHEDGTKLRLVLPQASAEWLRDALIGNLGGEGQSHPSSVLDRSSFELSPLSPGQGQ